MNVRSISGPTRILHLLLLVAVLHQLIGSTLMTEPKPGLPEDPLLQFHEWGGLTSLGVMTAFWLWTIVRRGETSIAALLPWFSARRVAAVWADLKSHGRALARFRLPEDRTGALASAVHGLGLYLGDPDGAAIFSTIEALTAHAVSAMAPHCEAIIAGASHPAHIRALRRAGDGDRGAAGSASARRYGRRC